MLRFIYFCMAIVALSFVAIPVYSGIAQNRDQITARDSVIAINTNEDDSLSFEEIYTIANEDSFNPESLNEIAPAAGGAAIIPDLPQEFSAEFKPSQNPAL